MKTGAPQIIDLIRKYQGSRTSGSEPDKQTILNELPTRGDPGSLEEDDAEINQLYRTYQKQRDPERIAVQQTIMTAAREKIARDCAKPDAASAWRRKFNDLFTAPGNWLDRVAESLGGPFHNRPLLAPATGLLAMAVVAMVTIRLLPVETGTTEVAALPDLLEKHASQLANASLSQAEAPFAFSGNASGSTPFRAGVAATDLRTAAEAGNRRLVESIAESLYPLASPRELARLKNELATLQASRKEAAASTRAIHAFATRIGSRLTGRNSSLFELGQWVEQTRLVAILALKHGKPEWLAKEFNDIDARANAWRQLMPPPASRQFEKLGGLTHSGEINLSEVREMKAILDRIKAIMSIAAQPVETRKQ